jgi:uncharacterized membrane protein (UPF0127 family)
MPRFHVLNQTRQVLVASDVECARTTWARLKGLLGRSREEFSAGKGLWITPSQGVHTVGMSFEIDVVYLDSKRRILNIYHDLPPNRLAAFAFRAKSVLELPAGTLRRTGTRAGDVLEFNEAPHDGS